MYYKDYRKLAAEFTHANSQAGIRGAEIKTGKISNIEYKGSYEWLGETLNNLINFFSQIKISAVLNKTEHNQLTEDINSLKEVSETVKNKLKSI